MSIRVVSTCSAWSLIAYRPTTNWTRCSRREKLGLDIPDADPALVVANLLLQARQHRDRVTNIAALT